MPKRKKCPICREDFPQRSFYRHYASYFDINTNSWIDHGSEADESSEREESEQRFKNLLADVANATDPSGDYFQLALMIWFKYISDSVAQLYTV